MDDKDESFNGSEATELQEASQNPLKRRMSIALAASKTTAGEEFSRSLGILVLEGLYNFAPLLLLPIALWREGVRGCQNRGLLPTKYTVIPWFWQWSSFAALVAANILYFLNPVPFISLFEVVFVDILWLLRSALNAIRMAAWTQKELVGLRNSIAFTSFNFSPEVYRPADVFNERTMVVAIMDTCTHQGVDLETTLIKPAPMSAETLMASLGGAPPASNIWPRANFEHQGGDGTTVTAVSAIEFLRQLMINGSSTAYMDMRVVYAILPPLQALIPLIIRAGLSEPPIGGTDSTAWSVFFLLLWVTAHTTYTTLAMIVTVIIYCRRENFVHGQLVRVLTEGHLAKTMVDMTQSSQDPTASIEQLSSTNVVFGNFLAELCCVFNVTVPINILAWWKVRCVHQRIGLLQGYRATAIVSAVIMAYAAMVVCVVIEGIYNEPNFDQLVGIVAFLCLWTMPLIFGIVSAVGSVNELRKRQAVALLKKKMMLETVQLAERNSKALKDAFEHMPSSIRLMDAVINAIKDENDVAPSVMLIFTNGSEMTRLLIVVGLAAFGLALRQSA